MVNDSDKTFFLQLILWTTANGISMVSSWALILAIVWSEKCRARPFNLYLLFSVLPEAYKNTSGFFANLTNMVKEGGSARACVVIGWNDAYWWCSNLWMACLVFFQLHKLLLAAKRCERHAPPSPRSISTTSLAVHAFAAAMASLPLLPVAWIPKATPASGCEAYPDNQHAQLVFYWAFFMPVTALAPTFLVTLLCLDIWWRKLLPVNGKTRSLLFYFARLLAVIYLVAAAIIVSFLFSNWVQAIAFVVFNLTGFFQVCLALLKTDVLDAWLALWACRKPPHPHHSPNSTSAASTADTHNPPRYSVVFNYFLSANRAANLRTLVTSVRNLSAPNFNAHNSAAARPDFRRTAPPGAPHLNHAPQSSTNSSPEHKSHQQSQLSFPNSSQRETKPIEGLGVLLDGIDMERGIPELSTSNGTKGSNGLRHTADNTNAEEQLASSAKKSHPTKTMDASGRSTRSSTSVEAMRAAGLAELVETDDSPPASLAGDQTTETVRTDGGRGSGNRTIRWFGNIISGPEKQITSNNDLDHHIELSSTEPGRTSSFHRQPPQRQSI